MSKRILVVDDSSFARNMIARSLANSEYKVVATATDGQNVLAAYQEHRPDLTTMDLTLPHVDGLECIRQIRAFDPAAKIIVVSALADASTHDKALQLGAKVLTVSDSDGYVLFGDRGMTAAQLADLLVLKNERRERLAVYAQEQGLQYVAGAKPWNLPCTVALPCATQNEIDAEEAKTLVLNGCRVVGEGANMPSTLEAVDVFLASKILYAPGKAANAGGVATSGLEMSQNAIRLNWTREEVDKRLFNIMADIHQACVEHGHDQGFTNYVMGANIAGFIKVAEAMLAQGVV